VYKWKALRLLSRNRLFLLSRHFDNLEAVVKQLDDERAATEAKNAAVRLSLCLSVRLCV
jgi:hypothetical protein